MLSLDHVNNDGHAHREEVGSKMYSWVKSHGFPEGFQTLCMNHQFKKKLTVEYKEIPEHIMQAVLLRKHY